MNYKNIIIDPGHGGIDFGHILDNQYEKDFNLTVSKAIYEKLKGYGYPVNITRGEDITLSNYDRYQYINDLIGDNKALVLSIQVDDENDKAISIIRSINSNESTNNYLYELFKKVGEVKTKTLVNNSSKDYYSIQRIAALNSDVVVIEFGDNYLNDKNKEAIVNQVVDVLVNYFTSLGLKKEDYETYIVKKGDYLYKIAKNYNTDVNTLKKVNNLGTDFLNIGEVLKVPKIKENIYIVKSGDSLYSIAKKFNTSVDKIKDINSLISNKLMINQKIVIPS